MTLPLRPKTSTRGGYRFAELALTRGPAVIGGSAATAAELLARVWAVEIRADDNTLRAYQRQSSGAWQRVTADLPPVFDAPLPDAARRVGVAFDQSSRLLIVYEAEGVVKVTRWDTDAGEYVQNVSFAGCDPCVVIDTEWTGDIPSSDVLIFYLSSDRQKVMCRVQREVYAVEREMWDYQTPVILDRVEPTLGRYQLLVSDQDGDPLAATLQSTLYGVRGVVSMAGDVAAMPAAGAYALIVLTPALTQQELTGALAATPTAGVYATPVIDAEGETQELTGALTTPTAGAYVNRNIEETTATQELTGALAATPTAGAYAEVVMVPALTAQALTGTLTTPTGGTYAA